MPHSGGMIAFDSEKHEFWNDKEINPPNSFFTKLLNDGRYNYILNTRPSHLSSLRELETM